MIYPILMGGLGNNIYQLANALRLQEKFGCEMQIPLITAQITDIPKYKHYVYKMVDLEALGGHRLVKKDGLPQSFEEIFPTLDFIKDVTIDEIIQGKELYYEWDIDKVDENSVVMGYFFPYKFIKDQIEKIRSLLSPRIELYLKKYDCNKNILGIHLRLGVDTDNNKPTSIPMEFYERIIEEADYDEIWVISDNTTRARKFLKHKIFPEVKLVEGEPVFIDMMILSKCNTLALAASTISTWGAYFSKAKVYLPKEWIKLHNTDDVPRQWIIR